MSCTVRGAESKWIILSLSFRDRNISVSRMSFSAYSVIYNLFTCQEIHFVRRTLKIHDHRYKNPLVHPVLSHGNQPTLSLAVSLGIILIISSNLGLFSSYSCWKFSNCKIACICKFFHACYMRNHSKVGLLSLIMLGDGKKLRCPSKCDILYSAMNRARKVKIQRS